MRLKVPSVVLLLASGCSVGDGPGTAAPDPSTSEQLLVARPSGGLDMAEIDGQAVLNESGCFVLRTATGEHPVVWPSGSTPVLVGGELRGVVLPQGVTLGEGQQVRGGGGYGVLADASGLASGRPESCGFDPLAEFAFLNTQPVTVSTPTHVPTG